MAARIWGAHTAERIGRSGAFPDCARCRRPGPEGRAKREKWGCDAPAERAVFTTGCSTCYGHDPECSRCEDGVIEHHRCPTALLQEADPATQGAASRAFGAYIAWDAHGVPPFSGGWMEQSAAFHQVCSVVGDERGRYNQIVADHQETERKRREAARRSSASKPPRGR